jgi:signal peptide peptidase SppA
MAHQLNHLLERVFNTPHLCTDAKLQAVIEVLCGAAGISVQLEPVSMLDSTGREKEKVGQGPMTIEDGVAVIPVRGTMTGRVAGLKPDSGMVGYNQIADMMDIAKNEPTLRHIAFAIDTHGGEAAGAFDLHDYIMSARGSVPMTAVLDSNALSAGYLLASACDEVVIPEFGHAGSIGVVMAHREYSGMLAKEGIKVNYIYAGSHKIDGAPTEPLTDTARTEAQSKVDALYDAFVTRVATARGMDSQAVRDTQALTYFGKDAIGKLLADRIATEREAMASIKMSAKPRTLITVPSFTMGTTTKG